MTARKLKAIAKVFGPVARLARVADLDDQVEACDRVFASETRWTVVRGERRRGGQGLPVWSRHVGDPVLERNKTRRVDFALFMVEALGNDGLVPETPAIVGCQTPSALATLPSIERRRAGAVGDLRRDTIWRCANTHREAVGAGRSSLDSVPPVIEDRP